PHRAGSHERNRTLLLSARRRGNVWTRGRALRAGAAIAADSKPAAGGTDGISALARPVARYVPSAHPRFGRGFELRQSGTIHKSFSRWSAHDGIRHAVSVPEFEFLKLPRFMRVFHLGIMAGPSALSPN